MSFLLREVPVSLASKCLVTVLLILVIAGITYAATVWFGIVEVLNKWYLAAIPSAVIAVLTVLFIKLNRFVWSEVESCTRIIFPIAWSCIIALFAATKSIIVYLGLFIIPISWLFCVKKIPRTDLSTVIIYGWHGGVGAYTLVCLTSFILGFAGIKLPIETANFLFYHLTTKTHLLTIVPYEVIASTLPAIPLLLFIYAAFVEEVMFRLPLILFKEFGMYTIGFLVSFIFTYLHILTRIDLPPVDLYQVVTSIAIANAVFIAIYTRTLSVVASTLSHIIYNVFVIMQIPCWLSMTILFTTGILVILYYRFSKR